MACFRAFRGDAVARIWVRSTPRHRRAKPKPAWFRPFQLRKQLAGLTRLSSFLNPPRNPRTEAREHQQLLLMLPPGEALIFILAIPSSERDLRPWSGRGERKLSFHSIVSRFHPSRRDSKLFEFAFEWNFTAVSVAVGAQRRGNPRVAIAIRLDVGLGMEC